MTDIDRSANNAGYPEDWLTRSYLVGHPLEQMEDSTEVLAIYQNVLKDDPRNIVVYLLQGLALLRLEREDEGYKSVQKALLLAEEAIQKNVNDALAHVYRADALWLLGMNEQALDEYDQAIQLAPDDPMAYVNKGWVLFTLNRHEEALALYRHAEELRPQDPDILSRESNVFWELHQYEEALRLIEQAIAIDPSQPRFYADKATTLSYMGHEEESREAVAIYHRLLQSVHP